MREVFEYERPEDMSDSSWEALCDALALYAEEWEEEGDE
jgi:hypothetical protein